MKVLDTNFFKGFIEMANYGDQLGWHERNGGNATYWLYQDDVHAIQDDLVQSNKWYQLVQLLKILQMNIF